MGWGEVLLSVCLTQTRSSLPTSLMSQGPETQLSTYIMRRGDVGCEGGVRSASLRSAIAWGGVGGCEVCFF